MGGGGSKEHCQIALMIQDQLLMLTRMNSRDIFLHSWKTTWIFYNAKNNFE